MSQEHKALLVERFKKEKLEVLMCGDGANDCMVLRKANIGNNFFLTNLSYILDYF